MKVILEEGAVVQAIDWAVYDAVIGKQADLGCDVLGQVIDKGEEKYWAEYCPLGYP
jgi:hypothetical protein